MVQSKVTFFGNNRDSLIGLKQSIIPFFILFIGCLMFVWIFKKKLSTYTVLASFVLALILSSCIGIQDISNSRNNAIWGLLVGWVVAAAYICLKIIDSEDQQTSPNTADISVLIGLPILTAGVAYGNSVLLKRSKFYRRSKKSK